MYTAESWESSFSVARRRNPQLVDMWLFALVAADCFDSFKMGTMMLLIWKPR